MTFAMADDLRSEASASPSRRWLCGLTIAVTAETQSLSIARRVLSQLGAHVVEVSSEETFADMRRCDIILVDRLPGPGPRGSVSAGDAASYGARVAETNETVWVTLSAYGLTDPRADVAASDFTLLAASGVLGHTPGPDGCPPTVPAGDIAVKIVGSALAMAALHGVQEYRSTGKPVHVDVSAQAAIIATGLALETSHALSDCPDVGGSARYGAPTGYFGCTDGSVYVLVLEEHQWAGFRRTVSHGLESIPTLEDARRQSDEVNAAMAAWSSTRTTADCERTLQDAGVPCTTVNTVEQFVERAACAGRPVTVAGDDASALPAQVVDYPVADTPRDRAMIPLQELRILDAGHVLAVPLAAAWLGAMGAQVTKLEDPERLDVYRRRGPFASGVPGDNRSAYFNHLNFCKTSMEVTAGGEAKPTDLQPFDVVLHNLSPHRASLLGVDPAGLRNAKEPKLQLASSGFGRTGTWSHYRAYGTTIHAFAGLIAATRNWRGEMAGVGTPWADPLTSVAITVWVLAWSLAETREGSTSVDVSMAECLATHLAEQIGRNPEENYVPPAVGGDMFFGVPGQSRLLAVSLADDDLAAFESITGCTPPTLTRRGERIDLDTTVDLGVLEASLQSVGIKAALVVDAHALATDERLFASEVFQVVHSSALGDYAVTGLPWRFAGRAKAPITAAPERI